jgi:hypothetical protein
LNCGCFRVISAIFASTALKLAFLLNTTTADFVSLQLRYDKSWSIKEGFFALPKFAFGDENVFSILPDEDIGLALEIESLAGSVPFISAVELDQKVRAQRLFIHLQKRVRAQFHYPCHVFHDVEDLFIVALCERRLRRETAGHFDPLDFRPAPDDRDGVCNGTPWRFLIGKSRAATIPASARSLAFRVFMCDVAKPSSWLLNCAADCDSRDRDSLIYLTASPYSRLRTPAF